MTPLFTSPMFAVWRAIGAVIVVIVTALTSFTYYADSKAETEPPKKILLDVTFQSKGCNP